MECGSFRDGEDGEYNGIGLVEIYQVVGIQDAYFFGTIPFDRVYIASIPHAFTTMTLKCF